MKSEAKGIIMMYNPPEMEGFTILRKGNDKQSEGKGKGYICERGCRAKIEKRERIFFVTK